MFFFIETFPNKLHHDFNLNKKSNLPEMGHCIYMCIFTDLFLKNVFGLNQCDKC
jgi:hypothetical protein